MIPNAKMAPRAKAPPSEGIDQTQDIILGLSSQSLQHFSINTRKDYIGTQAVYYQKHKRIRDTLTELLYGPNMFEGIEEFFHDYFSITCTDPPAPSIALLAVSLNLLA